MQALSIIVPVLDEATTIVDALTTLAPYRAEAQTATAKYEVALPKSWGKILSFSNQNLLMESTDGILRVVDLEGKPPEFPRVKVQARWQ